MPNTETFMRYARTLRHLEHWQIAGRIVAGAKRKLRWTLLPTPPRVLENRLLPTADFPKHESWNSRKNINRGRFKFLNEVEDLGRPIQWKAGHMPLLWRFNLHYFHYLHLLSRDEQIDLCRNWIRENAPCTGVGWHPYPTSLRIVNWCRAGLQDTDLLNSLYLQAAFLYRNLETYVYGNHLLENARALVLAGRLFEGQGEARFWLAKGLQLYREETPVQILSDGGHYERSPMYHALVLEGYLDVLNVLPTSHADRGWLIETVQRMADVLLSLTHPDGFIALFNDATREIAPAPAALQSYVHALIGYRSRTLLCLPEMGYFMHRGDDLYLIVDGGPAGPNHLLAHAHADIFSYELSIRGRQVVVDSGVFEYHDGPMRRYVRSTRAHNTVSVDGIDQIECWGSFRVARRFAPHNVQFSTSTTTTTFSGTYSGYAVIIGDNIHHHRHLCVDQLARTIIVQDRIDGSGHHSVENLLRLHPGVDVHHQNGRIFLQNVGGNCQIDVEPMEARWEKGWYCPEFGTNWENDVLVLGGRISLPTQMSYTVHF